MQPKQFSLRRVFIVTAISAVGFWFAMPTSKIVILIAPDNSLELNGNTFESEFQFWETLKRAVESCRAWQMEPRLQIWVSENLSHVPLVDVIMSLSHLDLQNKTVLYVDSETGELLDQPQ